MMDGLTIDEMRLSPNARKAAQLVLKVHPDIIFTSGRRDVRDQARAMAQNVHVYGSSWLVQTYKNENMVRSLLNWMGNNLPQTSTVEGLSEGFYQTLISTQAGMLSQFPHCRGDAFDASCPRLPDGTIDEATVTAIKHTIETLPVELGLQLILTKEGSHRIIHAQFAHAVQI